MIRAMQRRCLLKRLSVIGLTFTLLIPSVGYAQGRTDLVDKPSDLFRQVKNCWRPPPAALARTGTSIAVRASFRRDGTVIGQPRLVYITPGLPPYLVTAYTHAALATFSECTPLKFTKAFGQAFAGRIFWFRFNDPRPPAGGRAPI